MTLKERFNDFWKHLQSKTSEVLKNPQNHKRLLLTLGASLILVVVLLAAVLVFWKPGLQNTGSNTDGSELVMPDLPGTSLRIVTTTLPAYEAVRFVTGFYTADYLDNLIPFTQSDWTKVDLSQPQQELIQQADLVIALGEADLGLVNQIRQVRPGINLVTLDSSLSAEEKSNGLYWLDTEIMAKLVQKTQTELGSRNSEKSSYYNTNTQNALGALQSLAPSKDQLTKECQNKTLLSHGLSQLEGWITTKDQSDKDQFVSELIRSKQTALLRADLKDTVVSGELLPGQIKLVSTLQAALPDQIQNGATYTSLMQENYEQIILACQSS